MEEIVLKIGGSVITDKTKPFTLRKRVLNRIASEIAKALSEENIKLVLVHGGGSFGHFVALKYKDKFTVRAFIEIHEAMERLNKIVTSYLLKHGVNAVPINTRLMFILKNKEPYKVFLDPIINAVEKDLVPILYGDIVFDIVRKFSILSGDTIAPYIASKLNFNNLFYAINVNGVYRRYPPKSDKDLIETLNYNMLSNILEHSRIKARGIDVTGGMINKLLEIVKWVKNRKMKIMMFNALKPGYVYRALTYKNIPKKTMVKV